MKKVFVIDGGLGRCICALPALMKYAKNNPNDEWYVVMYGWSFITYGIKELQDRTYEMETKNIFENVFLKVDEVVTLEPYRIPEFYKKQISLIEAFDVQINQTHDHSDLERPNIVLSEYEILKGKEIINNARTTHKKEKTIVIQPYGSSAQKITSGVFDDSLRSLPEKIFLDLSKKLSETYNVIYFGDYEFYTQDYMHCLGPSPDPTIREWISIINESDYFIGCDSSGQHIAYSMETRGSVIMGATESINMSYPNFFNIIEKKQDKKYVPMRLSNIDCNLAQRVNREIFNYDEEDLNDLYKIIVSHIENSSTKLLDEELNVKKSSKKNNQVKEIDLKSKENKKELLFNFDYL
jgi:hypothetical protein